MQPVYQNPNLPTTESVYRTSTVIWAAMLLSQFALLFVLYFAKPQLFGLSVGEESGTDLANSNSLNPVLIVLAVVGLSALTISFVLKARMAKFAIEKSDVNLIHIGHVVAYALCEAASLFGLVAAFAFDSRYFWVWFAAGILGLALHYPRRESFHAAAFKGIT